MTITGATIDPERGMLILQQMPGFVAVLLGPQRRFDFVNDAYVAMSGDRHYIGRTVREVFPDVEGQGFFELLDDCFASGAPFKSRAMPIRLSQDEGALRYVDFLYQPIRNASGEVTGIFVGGYDVTESKRHQARLAALDELGDALRRIDDPEALPHEAAEILGSALNVSRVGYGAIDDAAESFTSTGTGPRPASSPSRARFNLETMAPSSTACAAAKSSSSAMSAPTPEPPRRRRPLRLAAPALSSTSR